MSKVEKMSIALTGQLAETVRVAVRSGDYASSSEVIREALRDWSEKRERKAESLAHVRALLQAGSDSGISERRRSADEIIAEGRRRLGAKD